MMKDLPIHPGVVRNIRLAFITRDNSAALLKALERCRQQGIKWKIEQFLMEEMTPTARCSHSDIQKVLNITAHK